MARRPSISSFGRGHSRGRGRGRTQTAAEASAVRVADSAQSATRASGNASVVAACPHRAAGPAVIAEALEVREFSIAAGPPGLGLAQPSSILANLRTRGFRHGTPFFATAARGAQFIRRALARSDMVALREFSLGTLSGHFWRDSSR
ncbi:hypothetical protein U1Q18_022878, partial [Sarracenia purpurea var. burkii]